MDLVVRVPGGSGVGSASWTVVVLLVLAGKPRTAALLSWTLAKGLVRDAGATDLLRVREEGRLPDLTLGIIRAYNSKRAKIWQEQNWNKDIANMLSWVMKIEA